IGYEMNDLSETRSPSSSVGDYLKAVWELAADADSAASTKSVATRLAGFGDQHVREATGDGPCQVRALQGSDAYRARSKRGFTAGTAAPSDRDIPVGAPRLRLAGGTR